MGERRWEYSREMGSVIDRAGRAGMPVAHVVLHSPAARRGAGELIAAAPDLLAACEASSAVVDHEGRCAICAVLPGGCDGGQQLRIRAAELRGAAIAKARGAGHG